MRVSQSESWGSEWVVFSGWWFLNVIGERGFSGWLSWYRKESGSYGWGVGMIVDVRGSEGDGMGSGMVTFALMVWGAETGG